jgi:hypothetical protein
VSDWLSDTVGPSSIAYPKVNFGREPLTDEFMFKRFEVARRCQIVSTYYNIAYYQAGRLLYWLFAFAKIIYYYCTVLSNILYNKRVPVANSACLVLSTFLLSPQLLDGALFFVTAYYYTHTFIYKLASLSSLSHRYDSLLTCTVQYCTVNLHETGEDPQYFCAPVG